MLSNTNLEYGLIFHSEARQNSFRHEMLSSPPRSTWSTFFFDGQKRRTFIINLKKTVRRDRVVEKIKVELLEN